jgi:small subunit ribosomal protein S19e
MANIYEIPSNEYNTFLAEEIKKMPEFKMPEWACFVKTSVNKERQPLDPEWWYKRVASILRQAHTKGVIGVNRLRVRYGGKKNRGAKPSEFRRASGKIIRTILQQAEKAEFLQKSEGKRKGRELTKKGKLFLEDSADKISLNKTQKKQE